jgi:hypothetical protein
MPVAAGCFWFAAIFALGFLLGPIRILVLEPHLGPAGAVAVEAVPMLAGMIALAPWAARLFDVPAAWRPRLTMGLTGLALTVAAETALAALLRGSGPGFWLDRATTPDGWIYLGLLGAFALMPLLRGGG